MSRRFMFRLTVTLVFSLFTLGASAQQDTVISFQPTDSVSVTLQNVVIPSPARLRGFVEIGGLTASSNRTPFWLRANQWGTVPLTSPAGLGRLGLSGRLHPTGGQRGKWFLNYSVEVVGQATRKSQFLLSEAYIEAGLGKFTLLAGRKRQIIGLGDSTLSSGFLGWSQSALPLHRVQIGTSGYVPLGFTKGLIALNFFFAHGWFAPTDSLRGVYLHQKALYGRIGKPNWRVKFFGGLLHNVMWGGRSRFFTPDVALNGQLPAGWLVYRNVVLGRQNDASAGGTTFDTLNAYGNHLGTIDIGIEITGSERSVLLYYQHPFEDRSGLALLNMPDGLYGIRIRNHNRQATGFQIEQFTAEVLTTQSQSGSTEVLSRWGNRYGGIDNYYNQGQYLDGWSHKDFVIGTPFITRYIDTRPEWWRVPNGFGRFVMMNNNRVTMYYVALQGVFRSGLRLEARAAYSQNYGTFYWDFRQMVPQFSGLLRISQSFKWLQGSTAQAALSFDQGRLYTNTIGGIVTLRKDW